MHKNVPAAISSLFKNYPWHTHAEPVEEDDFKVFDTIPEALGSSNNTAYNFFVVTHSVRMIFSSSSKLIMVIKIIIMTRTTVLESNEIADDNI